MINKANTTWQAGRNFPEDTPLSYIKQLMGFKKSNSISSLPVQRHPAELVESLPEIFDPRKKWPQCSSLNEIRDQGGCGSCWAFGAVSAMTDRVCIYSKGTQNFHFSAQDLTSCCNDCDGCNGGDPVSAWYCWKESGIVSGGPFKSGQGCRPYELEPCEHHINGTRKKCPSKKWYDTPACRETCENSYKIGYKQDKRFGKNVYEIDLNEDQIRAELYQNGPVEAVFQVFDDFLSYKSGVYRHTHGVSIGYHAVKIMGWGVEGGTKYWLVANSWNTDWGDHGFFKFLRGENHCGIEGGIVAGEPLL
ncbi:papain family cysteine protease domain-containing protein [Phthorimaea operculella]|nr:papain family cysteine protease domain-containing protein [Phthorimaea operculella]